MGALLRAGPVRHAGHRRRRLHEHEHQADGRRRARSCSTTSSTRRTCSASRPPTFVTPDTRANAQLQHWSLRNAAIFYFLESARLARPRLDHAAALDEDADEPARERVLQLRAVPARRGPGDAVLVRSPAGRSGRACRGCRGARPTTTCATRWSKTLAEEDVEFDIRAAGADRSVPDADREQRPCCGRRSSRRACRPPRCASRGRRSTRPSSSTSRACSPTTPGTASPSTARSETRAARGKRMYSELSQLRQKMNDVEHYEPTGDEDVPRLAADARAGSAALRGPAGRSRRRP